MKIRINSNVQSNLLNLKLEYFIKIRVNNLKLWFYYKSFQFFYFILTVYMYILDTCAEIVHAFNLINIYNFIVSKWKSSNLKCSMIGINANIFKIVSFVISVHPYIDNFFKYLHPLRRYLRLLSLKNNWILIKSL